MNNKKLANRGKNLRPCSKFNNATKSLTKVSKICTHIPIVRCHEEIMCTSHNIGHCIGKSVKFIDKSQDHKKHQKRGKLRNDDNIRFGCSKSKDVYRCLSAPLTTAGNLFSKTIRSKSTPHVQKSNLEDSIDFIPVKLSSNNEHKYLSKQKSHFQNLGKEKCSRAIWEELLNKSQNSLIKNSDKILNSGRHSETNIQIAECVTNTAKKSSDCVLNGRQNGDVTNNLLKPLNFPNSYDQQSPIHTCDPLQTLDFIIKQLQEKLIKRLENDNVEKIIVDIENALFKISADNQIYSRNLEKNSYNVVDAFSNTGTKSMLSSSTETKRKNTHLKVAQLQKALEESCIFLQRLCIKQKKSCNNHVREKKQLTLQLAESRRLLNIAKSREKDYEVTIGELRLKIQEISARKDQQFQEVQELTNTVAKLINENKLLGSFKDEVKILNFRLKEHTCEKENLLSKLSLKELEIEKLKVLLEVKENISASLICKKNGEYKEYIEHKTRLDTSVEDRENSSLSASTVKSWNQEKTELVCSSQASSSPRHSHLSYNSWQHTSSHCQRSSAANKDIASPFQYLKTKKVLNEPPQLDLEILSSSISFWSDENQCANTKLKFSDFASGTSSS